MAVIDLKNGDFTMNIVLKNGEVYEGKDIPTRPFGEAEHQVAFWHEGKLRCYPMADVKYWELVPQG